MQVSKQVGQQSLGRAINHSLHSRIEKLAYSNVRRGIVSNTAFNGVRNRSAVRSVMAKLGYVPNNSIHTAYWTHETAGSFRRAAAITEQKVANDSAVSQLALLQPKPNLSAQVRADFAKGGWVDSEDYDHNNKVVRAVVVTLQSKGFKFDVGSGEESGLYRLARGQNYNAVIAPEPMIEVVKAALRSRGWVSVSDFDDSNSVSNAVRRLRKTGVVIDSNNRRGDALSYIASKIEL